MARITRRAAINVAALASAVAACPACIVPPAGAEAPPRQPPAEPPWERRRGVRTIDYNNYVIFVRASMDDMAHALAARSQRWEKDVLGHEIVLSRDSAFVFRLRGHAWTIVVPWDLTLAEDLRARAISNLLKVRVIGYGVSDTTASVGYALYDHGELLEEFNATEGSKGRPDASSGLMSRMRPLKLEDVANIWDFTHQFLVDQDVLEPGIDFNYFLGANRVRTLRGGEKARIVNPGFSWMMPGGTRSPPDVPPIERVDYWVALPPKR
jgi:hypothetical protein